MSKPDDTVPAPPTVVSRRDFFTTAASVGAAVMIVPRRVLGRGFQAPSDTVNVAVVGINGMGAVNARAVMSQNIVAICDCDDSLLEGKLAEWTKAVRSPAAPRPAAPPKPATAWQGLRPDEGTARRGRAMGEDRRERDAAAVRRRADSAASALPRLPGDAREAERHRRGHRRHARPHARDHRVGRDGRRQARVRAEAALLVGARSAAPGEESRGHEGRDADGQSAALAGRPAPRRRLHPGRSDRRRRAKSTSGPIARSASGRRESRAPHRPRRPHDRAGTIARWTSVLPPRWRATTRCQDHWPGISFSASRRRSPYHPIYHPFNWRGWVDWGVGALGDMGAHLIDFPMWALDLGLPTVDRNRSDAVQRRDVSECDDDVLPVRRARRQTGGEADVVRRRPDAGGAGRTRRRQAESRRRRSLRRQEGQAPAGERLAGAPPACCRGTTPTARRAIASPASPTKSTR